MDGDEGGPAAGGGVLTAQQDEEAEEAHDELQSKQAHGDESHPAVQGVEVADGRLRQVVVVQDRDEAHHDAGHGQGVEDGVEELDVDAAAAAADAVEQHGEPAEGDEAGHHEDGVQVELLGGVLGPREALAVLHHPEEDEHQGADQQDDGQRHHQQELEPVPARPAVVLVIVAVRAMDLSFAHGEVRVGSGRVGQARRE